MKKRNITLFTAFAAAIAFASAAQAQTIISGETATASSDFFGTESWGRPVEALVNDLGMTGEGATGLHANTAYEHAWQTGQTTAPWIKVDLGGTYDVGKMYVWNGAPPNKDWGAQTVDIYYATTDPGVNVNDSEAAFNPAGWTLWSSGVTFAKHAGSGSYLPTDDFDLNVTARYIALNVTVAYGGINNASIAELQFFTAGSTPPAADPEITSITSLGGGSFELTLKGEPSTSYEFYSSATLDFTSGGTLVSLTGGGTDVTTDGSGDATVQMTLTGSANFVRAQ